MRTTLDIDDDLLAEARRQAREKSTTLTAVIEAALAAFLTAPQRTGEPFQLRLKTASSRYIGGVDITDRDALYDRMEGH